MKTKITRLLLSAVMMMCCVNVWALYGSRGGTCIGQDTVKNKIYDLYQNYSYTYEGTTQSVNGNCAVLVGFYFPIRINEVDSMVSYGGSNYTVVAIGEQVFINHINHAYGTEEFTIPNTVRVLEAFALEDYKSSLNKIILEDGDAGLFCYRTTKGYGAFSWNAALKNVYIGRNLKYQEQNNNKTEYAPFYKGDFSGLSVEFGPKVAVIPQNCFYSSDVSSIDFSKATSLNTIGHHAFYWNNSCTEIDLRNCSSNLVIGESSFQDCDALQKVTIGSADQIVDYAFYDCNVLSRVYILGDVSCVRPYAFRSPNLALVYFLSSKSPVFENDCFNSSTTVYVRDTDRLNDFKNHYNYTGGIYAVVPETHKLKYTTVSGQPLGGITCLLDTYEDGVGTMYLDYELTEIADETFRGNNDLQSIIIPPAVKKIGNTAFYDCKNLVSVSIPNSVTSIEEYAFCWCRNLRTVLISGNLTSIGDPAFCECYALNEIFYLGNTQPSIGTSSFSYTPATIYVKNTSGFDSSWGGRPVKSWRSGKGDGTKGNPLVIEDYAQLMGFAIEVSQQGIKNLCGILAKDIVGNSNVLKSDGSVNGNLFKEWMPIGSATNVFCGEFNGGGHTISGLYHSQSERGSCVGLFGRTGGGAYIHDLGLVDSYMSGGQWNAGICGDMAYGLIDNCYNAATVTWGGGITSSCWVNAQITNCFNIGHIYNGGGGITAIVYSNPNVTYGIDNCYSLTGVSNNAINEYDGNCTGKVNNVEALSSDAFASGEVCWKLNGKAMGTQWSQKIGTDKHPKFTGTNVVYHDDVVGYVNVTKCDVAQSGLHSFNSRNLSWCDGTKAYYLHCGDCGKYYQKANLSLVAVSEPSTWTYHDAKYVAVVLPTPTETGIKHHWHCQRCNEDFTNEECTNTFTSVNPIEIPTIKNNEVWYSTTDNKTLSFSGAFNTSIKTNTYKSDYGVSIITFNEEVTAINDNSCTDYNTLVSIHFPSTVKSIGVLAFYNNGSLVDVQLPSSLESVGEAAFGSSPNIKSLTFGPSLKSVGMFAFQGCDATLMTFKSLPNIDNNNFWNANSHLDLTDSDKPFIGTTSLPKNLKFVGAQYHRTLEQDKWGTIVLPFAPTGGMEGLEFYELKEMTTASGGSLVFTKVETVKAGVPYLFRNTSSTTDFTLTNAGNPTVTVGISNQTAGDFTLKGSFQQTQLDGATNGNLYYLKGNEFYHANGKINIAPFRAYIEGNGSSQAKSFMLVVSDNVGNVTAVPGIMDRDGNIDETEAIYDLNGRRLTAPVKGQVNIIRTKSGKTIKRMF